MSRLPDHDPFAPPPASPRLRAWLLAIAAHGLLVAALLWVVRMPPTMNEAAIEAELWSALPQEAAPPAPVPEPVPEPKPEPEPEPVPTPAPVVTPPKPAPVVTPLKEDDHEAEIALERKKKAEQAAREQRLQKEKAEKEKAEKEKERQKELAEKREKDKERQKELAQKREKEKEQRERQERLEKEKAERIQAEKAEKAKAEKAAEDKRKKAEQAAKEAKAAQERRAANLERMRNLAGAGAPSSQGSAERASSPNQGQGQGSSAGGPSRGYGAKVAAKVKPNIVYPDNIAGNPRAEVAVRTAPDGTITSVRITQSSGNSAWDQAVVRALHKTDTLPRDVDGRVPDALTIGFRPKD